MSAQLTDAQFVQYHNWLKVGLAIRKATDGTLPFFTKNGLRFFSTVVADWKKVPLSRAAAEWTDADLVLVGQTKDGADAGTKYKSSEASQARKDFAEVIRQHHINQPATNTMIKYEHCNAQRWCLNPNGWLELLKAYIKMPLGKHEQCAQKNSPDQLDMCGILRAMNFCKGFSDCIDQQTTGLPPAHPEYGADGTLDGACNVRNRWAHNSQQTLDSASAKAELSTLQTFLQDDTDPGGNSLLHDTTVSIDSYEVLVMLRYVQAQQAFIEISRLHDSIDDPSQFDMQELLGTQEKTLAQQAKARV